MAFTSWGARYTLCAGVEAEGCVKRPRKKAYLEMDDSQLGKVNTAWELALISAGSDTYSLRPSADEMQGCRPLLTKRVRGHRESNCQAGWTCTLSSIPPQKAS